MRAVEVNRIDIFFELQQYRNVRDQRMRCFLCAYFLYAQEIGERKREGYAPQPPCRPHFKCADGGDSVSENNAFATKVGRKGCLHFLGAPRVV